MNSLDSAIHMLQNNVKKGFYKPDEIKTVNKIISNLKWLKSKIDKSDEELIKQMFEPSQKDIKFKKLGNKYFQK